MEIKANVVNLINSINLINKTTLIGLIELIFLCYPLKNIIFSIVLLYNKPIMIFVDEKVEEIRRSGLPLREMTDRQCYEIGCALDNVFGNSAFAELPNGRRIFDRVWAKERALK